MDKHGRLIDADVLIEILTTAIRNMKGMAKFLGAEDDPEIKMEIKAYTDILEGVKEQPTIEPERKKGSWIPLQLSMANPPYQCSCCFGNAPMVETGCLVNRHLEALLTDFCPHCGADMRGEQDGEST